MKIYITYFIIILTMLIFKSGLSQVAKNNDHPNAFNWKECKNKVFVSTNTGIRNTPFGLRIGLLCKTGMYIGTRFGEGKVYHVNTGDTIKTTLFSITGGIIEPIFVNNNFSLFYICGIGYGKWWKFRQDNWTKDGGEMEVGLSFSYKKIICNFSTNALLGNKTYSNWDFTVGLGYRFL